MPLGRESRRDGGEHPMRVLSVNVGLPREVIWRGKSVALAPPGSALGAQGTLPHTRASLRHAAGSWWSPWKTASTLFPSGSMTNAA